MSFNWILVADRLSIFEPLGKRHEPTTTNSLSSPQRFRARKSSGVFRAECGAPRSSISSRRSSANLGRLAASEASVKEQESDLNELRFEIAVRTPRSHKPNVKLR